MSASAAATPPPAPLRLSPDVEFASGVSIARCTCDNIYVRLHDGDGVVFAAGGMSPARATELAEQILDQVAKAVAAGGRAN